MNPKLHPSAASARRKPKTLTVTPPVFPAYFYEEDPSALPVSWHSNREFTLVILTRGTLRLFLGGEEAELRAGDGYLVADGALFRTDPLSNQGIQHRILFDGSILGACDPEKGTCDIFYQKCILPFSRKDAPGGFLLRKSDPESAELLSLAEKAWISGAGKEADYELNVRSLLSRILSRLLRKHGLAGEKDLRPDEEREKAERYRRQEMRTRRILTYLEENFTEDLSIGELSVCAGISVSECLRCFRTVLHTTPIQYLKQYRLEKSAEMLLSPDYASVSISDIARSVGFADMSYFTRAFRTRYRMTPSAWRKEH